MLFYDRRFREADLVEASPVRRSKEGEATANCGKRLDETR